LENLTTITYDLAGNVLSMKNALGVVTSYAYDALNRQTREIDDYGGSLQRTITTTYDAVGNVQTTVDGLGHAITYSYDTIDRVSTITNALGDVTTYSYTANQFQGKVETDTNALGDAVTYTYNGAGEVTSIYKLNGYKETFTYDAAGNQSSDNVAGSITTYAYDALNRETTITNALNGVTTYVLDAADNRTVLVDADSNRTTFSYDADNRLTTQTDPLNHSSTFSYGAVGELISTTDNNGRRDDFTYDANGNKLTESWYNNAGTFQQTLTFTYDAIGEMLSAQSPGGNNTFTYDHLGRVSTVNEPFGLTLTYTYDAADNRSSMQDSKGGLETFAYDAGNRLTQVQFTGQSATLSYDYAYDKIGEVTGLTRYSDLAGTTTVGWTSYSYDPRGNVTAVHHYDSHGSSIQSLGYTWTTSDQLQQKVVNGVTTNYSYDSTNQLTNDGSVTYTYDANGNRTMTGYSTTANEITTDGTWNYTYDNEGNRIKMVSIATGATWKFSYDNHNQLTAANYYSSDGGTLLAWVTYTTDALGHLIERDASSGQQTIRYAYDGDNAWADLDGSNNLATRRLFGPGADNPVVKISAAGVVVWYLLDYQNSVIGMVNSSGTSLGSVTYDGFGKVLTNTLGSYADAYMFQGARRDADTGMDYHDARWYDPNTGSWISRDPGGFAMGDANLSRFVGNEPSDWTDPTGLEKAVGMPQNMKPGYTYVYVGPPTYWREYPPGHVQVVTPGWQWLQGPGNRTVYYPPGFGPGPVTPDWTINVLAPRLPMGMNPPNQGSGGMTPPSQGPGGKAPQNSGVPDHGNVKPNLPPEPGELHPEKPPPVIIGLHPTGPNVPKGTTKNPPDLPGVAKPGNYPN
jgi:RHS repeat-associated protein